MNAKVSARVLGTLLAGALALAGCGGGGGGIVTFVLTLTSVDPAVSTNLDGDETVDVRGANFSQFTIVSVTFGGQAATIVSVDDQAIRVTTPAAPGGQPGLVDVAVNATDTNQQAVSERLTGGYRYDAPPGGGLPQPVSIQPTTFSATGAEAFTIAGTDLGPLNGTVDVEFSGAGTVTGQVSANGTTVTGFAPVTTGEPPAGAVTVTIDTGTAQGVVPDTVTYDFAALTTIVLSGQVAGGTSQPVRLGDDAAVVCSSTDGTWGDANDQVVIIAGPKSSITTRAVTLVGGGPVGYLDPNNSIPVALDGNTICLYSLRPGPTPTIVQISGAGTNPVVTLHPVGGGYNPAPLARISANRIAFTQPGPLGGTNVLSVIEFTGAVPTGGGSSGTIGAVDPTPGPANRSIPYSPDGENVFVYTSGPDATFGNANDLLNRFTVSNLNHISVTAPSLLGPPVAISGSLAVAPGPGVDGFLGSGNDDVLILFDAASGAFGIATHRFPSDVSIVAPVLATRLGLGGILVPVVGDDGIANTADDEVCAFVDPVAGGPVTFAIPRIPLIATLGSGAVHVFGRGPDGLVPSADDSVTHIAADASAADAFVTARPWGQAYVPLSDATRSFLTNGSGQLVVYQSLALGAATDSSALPLVAPGAIVTGAQPFVPVGPDWGLAQSPGPNGLFGDVDDALLIACY